MSVTTRAHTSKPTDMENELNEWLTDARQWERRFDVLRTVSRCIGVEVDEVEDVVIKDGKERRVIWSGVEIRRYDHNGRLLSITREGKESHNRGFSNADGYQPQQPESRSDG